MVRHHSDKRLLYVVGLAVLTLVPGCSSQVSPQEGLPTASAAPQPATPSVERGPMEKAKELPRVSEGGAKEIAGSPAQWGFPPGQERPWPIRVTPTPLAPSRSTNTGDFKGRWPDYRPPTAIEMTPPEVPPQILGASQGFSPSSAP